MGVEVSFAKFLKILDIVNLQLKELSSADVIKEVLKSGQRKTIHVSYVSNTVKI